MASSFEKSVKGGTKIKLAPPKSKYVEHILQATHAGDAGVAEIFRTMTNRLRDSTWTIVFKGLIIVHLMIREGESNVTLKYLSEHPSKLAISNFNDAQDQGRNIRHYYSYIITRAKAYRDTKTDWVREGQGRLKRLSVDKGLLRETEVLQRQITELVKCDLLSDPENEISLTAFRLLTMDLLKLYSAMNEGVINILEHFFEMSKPDAERALAIYKTFAKQTEQVVQYLSVARMYEGATRLEIPKLRHAPIGLTQSLTEYVNDPDFEINRRQYMAQQEAKRTGKPVKTVERDASANGSASNPSAAQKTAPQAASAKGPAPDLIDLFGSIENNQQPMAMQADQIFQSAAATQQQPFQTGGTNPFASMVQQPNMQASIGNTYNPFASQGQMQNQPTFAMGGQPVQQPQQLQQSFTPQQQPLQHSAGPDFFGQQQPQQQVQMQAFQTSVSQTPLENAQPQLALSTGQSQQQSPPFGQTPQQTGVAGLLPQHTSTNPFRQSMMPQATGMSSSPFSSTSPVSPQATNPFARNTNQGMPAIQESSPFSSQAFQPSQPQPQQQQQQTPFFTGQQPQSQSPFQTGPAAHPLQPTKTGTNPFARITSPTESSSPSAAPLMPTQTGSTNPFRQSQFVNQQTGQGWQNTPQGTIGGMDVNLFQSNPVFPRPGQPSGQQQQQAWP